MPNTGKGFSEIQSWCILGGSRGLGKQLAQQLLGRSQTEKIQIISRRPPEDLIIPDDKSFSHHSFDFSKKDTWLEIYQTVLEENCEGLIYCAGGGPYGYFETKDWKDHEWAMRVTFEFPAYLIWNLAKFTSNIQQAVFVGSQIAEVAPDLKAGMYCASKHALKGLIDTVQLEAHEKGASSRFHLFSPGYFQSDLLPENAWPRQQGLAKTSEQVAEDFFRCFSIS